MEENVFGSIDDIDAKLDEEFGKDVATEPEETSDVLVETQTEVETEEVSNEEPEEEQKEEVKEIPQQVEEGKSESKKDYAFSNLRAENSNLKKERDDYKADSDYLKELAASYGYDDVSKFQEAIRTTRYQKEAQDKGYDPVLYKKAMEQERRIAELEKERDAQETQRKLDRFKTALDKAVADYGIEEQEIFERLEDAGIAVEDILNINNPKLLLDGVLVDKIQHSAKQNQIEDLQNLKSLAEDKNENAGTVKAVTIEDLLASDMAKYKRDNFID